MKLIGEGALTSREDRQKAMRFTFRQASARSVTVGVTAHQTAEWTPQQLRDAFPWDSAPRYLLRDRDRIFGREFVGQVTAMGIKQVLSAPRSPWQRAYVERVIRSIRREGLSMR